jgi:hypothetical protein
LQSLEKAIQEHIDLTKRQQGEAQKRKEELQEEPENEEDGGALRTLAIQEVEERSRLLEADQASSGVMSSQLRSRPSNQESYNTYNAAFSGNNNRGLCIGYNRGPVNYVKNN